MKKKPSFLTFIIYLIAIAIICAVIFIYYFQKKIGPGLIKCAEDEVNQLTSLVMNNCIRKYIEETPNLEILKIERNESHDIERIQYDTKILNQTRTTIIDMLENDLNHMSEGNIELVGLNLNKLSDDSYEKTDNGIILTVSAGSATGNYFFANLGPKIPLNLKTVGDISANINTNITEYGLNNAMIEVNIELKTTTIIHMPFLSKEVTVTNTIPLTIEIIQGTIPGYYLSNNLT